MTVIRKGDLVMVIRSTPCCGNMGTIGQVFVADEVYVGSGYCFYCQQHHLNVLIVKDQHDGHLVLRYRLLKLAPGEFEGGTKTEHEELCDVTAT